MNNNQKLKVLILTDSSISENDTFAKGIAEAMDADVMVENHKVNMLHGSKLKNLLRIANYFTFPMRYLCKLNKYDYILGWQQFYANNLAFYSSLLGLRQRCKIVSVNYTYKDKAGVAGRIYKWYMRRLTNTSRMYRVHLLGKSAAVALQELLGTPFSKVIVTSFGVDDIYADIKGKLLANVNRGGYLLSLGRSNRDFDFLVEVFKHHELKDETLVILSDTWKPSGKLPDNVIHKDNVVGRQSQLYLAGCKANILPIDEPQVCSGDTVLLHGMQYERPTVITSPSTLAEMYIDNGVNGLCLPKNVETFAASLALLLKDKQKMESLGANARRKFLECYSREAMGRAIGRALTEAR